MKNDTEVLDAVSITPLSVSCNRTQYQKNVLSELCDRILKPGRWLARINGS